MKKRLFALAAAAVLALSCLSGCTPAKKEVRIGVSFGVGAATRWVLEQDYMIARAEEKGAAIEVRLNRTDEPKTQAQDCMELIDSGIDVLILTPRDAGKAQDILAYAKEKKVPVISYARVVLDQPVDLFVGYDSTRIGQKMGQYLSELVLEGDYIFLRGSDGDNNAQLLYDGAMRYLDPLRSSVNVLLDEAVPGWSPDSAKEMVLEAVAANGGQVDAILAPNDAIAGACVEALAELGVTAPVVITGMDAELSAAQRIVAGTQNMTVYMDLHELANIAIDQACRMANGEAPEVNAEFDNQSGGAIPSNLISGQIVTRENLDKILIDSGYITHDQVYGATS